jgi:transposase-like protein
MQAWLQSGVTRGVYCRDNRLGRATMMRWIKALEIPIPERRAAPKKQRGKKKKKFSRMPAARTIAFKAFWMMHAEAHLESGLTAVQYANAHRLPVVRMRRESRQFALIVPPQDWRQMLHPSNRPPGSYRSKIRDELRTSLWISPAQQAQPGRPATDGKRRQYTDKQKLAIVAEFAERGVTASMIARRHHVTPSMVFRWRDEFNLSPKKKQTATLVTATVIDRTARGRPKKTPLVLENLLPMPAGSISVELADGRRVYAPAGCDPDNVRQYIAQKESRP